VLHRYDIAHTASSRALTHGARERRCFTARGVLTGLHGFHGSDGSDGSDGSSRSGLTRGSDGS